MIKPTSDVASYSVDFACVHINDAHIQLTCSSISGRLGIWLLCTYRQIDSTGLLCSLFYFDVCKDVRDGVLDETV